MPQSIQPSLTLSPSGPWTSAPQSSSAGGATFHLCLSELASGQSVALRLIAYDAFGNGYFVGAVRNALTASGQYLYVAKPGSTVTGGAIPSDGAMALPVPENFAVQLEFGDTSGTKAVTFSLSFEERA